MKQLVAGAVLFLLGTFSLQADVTLPHTFSANTPAVAAEVNANFETLRAELSTALVQIQALTTRIQTLEADPLAQLTVAQRQHLADLGEVITVYPNPALLPTDTGAQGPLVRFTGVNVQVVNGVDQTTVNGLGNLIVGYDNPRESLQSNALCSGGGHDNQASCEGAGLTWAKNHKSGSHNLVTGDQNSYSQHGGLVAGFSNAITAPYASVSGGSDSTAIAEISTVSGGFRNTASGFFSSVSGGTDNTASGGSSSVSGGTNNTASGGSSSVSGGSTNIAEGSLSSVLGGDGNTAAIINEMIPN